MFTGDYDIPRRQRRPVLVLASLVGELDDFLVLDGHSLELSDVLVPTAGGPSSDLSAEVTRALQDTIGVDGSLLHVVESGKEDVGHSFLSEWAEGHQLENPELRIESGDVESVIVKLGPEYSLVIIGATERGLLSRIIAATCRRCPSLTNNSGYCAIALVNVSVRRRHRPCTARISHDPSLVRVYTESVADWLQFQ